MRLRFQPWQLAAVLVLLCAAAVGILEWRRSSRVYDASRLMQTLPVDGAVKLFIDVDALRDAGLLELLAGPKTVEDPDYRRFSDEIGFDYRSDLDAVAAVFAQGGFYAAARGHFDWKRLSDYAREQKGQCSNGICNLPGGQPDRIVSFYPLSADVLALAVSDKPSGVSMIAPPAGHKNVAVPPSAFWISAPGSDYKDLKNLPNGTQQFLNPLADSREASFGIQASSSTPGEFEIRMDVTCTSADSATALARVFTSLTGVLSSLLVKEGQAPPRTDLAAVLISGRFEAHDATVTGRWPMDRRVIETLVSDQMK